MGIILPLTLPHSKGDGMSYPRNPKADELLTRLAAELVDADTAHLMTCPVRSLSAHSAAGRYARL